MTSKAWPKKAGKMGMLAGLWLVLAGTVQAQPGSLPEKTPPILLLEEGIEQKLPEADAAEGAEKKEGAKADAKKTPPSFWEKNPPVRIFPRIGNFPILPSGEGYYSLHDHVTDNFRDKAPKFTYPPFGIIQFSFFDADFRYLDNPKNTQHDLFDCLHRIHLHDCWMFSTGGDFRYRYVNEIDARLSGKDNTYDLLRTRVYGDLWYGNSFRIYVEYLDAHSFNEDLKPLLIDKNRSDLLNAFVDIKVGELDDLPAYLRVGRQEILLGSQRTISPLDWANTRRAYQGVRGFHQGEKFDVDLFWVQPVLPESSRFDSVNNNVNFAGVWTTYRPKKGRFVDLYYLFLDNTSKTKELKDIPGALTRGPFNTSTFGTRYCGDKDHFLWDVEGMLQGGEVSTGNIFAGAATVGGGYNFADCPMNPTFWAYYDYASGDRNPNKGDLHTYNQQFPFGHYYLGWLDQVGRQNIHDANMHLFLYPTKYVTFWAQYHHFWLASSTDALYNAAGVATRRDPTGKAGNNVGDEVDFVLNVHLGTHSDLLLGYSKLFAGDFIKQTGSPRSPEFFFGQYSFRW